MPLVFRNTLNRPLTNAELDNNFDYLNTEVEARYKIEDFTAAKISLELNTTLEGQTKSQLSQSNALDAWELRGLEPSVTFTSGLESIMKRDTSGDVTVRNITGDLIGNADTASEAEHAASSADLDDDYIVPTTKGGTGAATLPDARASLQVVGVAGGEQMTGTLQLLTSLPGKPSIRFGVGDDTTSGLANGDVWFTADGIRYRINGVSQTVANLESPVFTGTPEAPYGSGSSRIGTVNHIDDATDALFDDADNKGSHPIDKKANLESPVFTGTPEAPTASRTTDTVQIATTAFVHTVSDYDNEATLTSAKDYTDSELQNKVDGLFNDPDNYGDHLLDKKANVASPGFSGTPTAPTPLISDNSTRIATTAYTISYVSNQLTSYYTSAIIDQKQPLWGTSKKFVQSNNPGSDAADGDFWFKI